VPDRVVALDELSYDQTFEHRFSGLAMPAFEIRSESVVFSDLKPAGVLHRPRDPSFSSARRSKTSAARGWRTQVKLAGSPRRQAFDAHATLFSDASGFGWTTGGGGLVQPLLSILAGTLNTVFGAWAMANPTEPCRIICMGKCDAPLASLARAWNHEPGFAQQRHVRSCRDPARPRVDSRPEYQFCLHHLPVAFILPVLMTNARGRTGFYIDNLALADKSLGNC